MIKEWHKLKNAVLVLCFWITKCVHSCLFFVCGKILPAVLEAEAYISARLSFSHRHWNSDFTWDSTYAADWSQYSLMAENGI